jgi:hypothetical protein
MTLQFTLGSCIGSEFGVWNGKAVLPISCNQISGDDHIDPGYASVLIMERLWQQLRESHKLRIIK